MSDKNRLISNMLEKLGFKSRVHVGISLSANNFIELICVDKATKTIVKYVSGNIKYNNAIREIMDYDEFAEVLEGLFDEAGLSPSECAVTLNIPNVHFGITSLDSESETGFIIENLQSEIEDLYIFKRNEPVLSFSKLESGKGRTHKNIVYSAVQAKVMQKIVEIFDNMQCDLVRIDTSYSSLLKTIQFCDRFNKYVQKEEKTSILLITPNSCCTFYLEGNILVDSFEEPIAVKSFSTEEVYSTISKIANNSIQKNNPHTLLIISETDEVNSEVLSSRLDFAGEIDCINKSINVNEQFIEVSGMGTDIDANMISFMTLEAVGAAVADYDDYPLNLNFMPLERINANMVEVGPYEIDFSRLVLVLIGSAVVVGVLLAFAISGILKSQINSSSDEASTYQKRSQVFKNRLETSSQDKKKNLFPVLKQIVDNNTAIINAYNSLSTEIPENIYIRKFVTNDAGAIGIVGEAQTSESVNAFVNGLREKNQDLTLSKLSVNTSSDIVPGRIPDGFTFEIKTKSHDITLNENEFEVQQQNPGDTTNNNSGAVIPPPPVI